MSNRHLIIRIHVVLAALFLPFMLLMPLTGGLYLLGYSGDQLKEPAFTVIEQLPEEKKDRELFFRDQFKKQNLDYEFEVIRENGNDFTFRPQSKVFYTATKNESDITFTKVTPNLLRRLVEIHKGHGPIMIKWVQTAFAVTLLFVAFSGLFLAFSVPTYRKISILSFVIGFAIILASLI